MTLNNIKKMKDERGFTIVELLIVIVVIGILAAIVIVAYAGVTSRANTSKAQSNAVGVQKVAETINADNGSYPATKAAFTAGSVTTKLPAGVSVASGGLTAGSTEAVTRAYAGANDLLPTSNSAAYSTIAVYGINGALSTGGVIYYRAGDGSIGGPTYYGAASSSSVFAQLP
jgi:prepilin-type N-terminal cleavage/methylation domain-containing protein